MASMAELLDGPAAPAPPGLTSNLQNPPNRNHDVIFIIALLGIAVSTLLIFIRIYTKAFLAKIFSIDDVCLFVAWVLNLGVQGIILFLDMDNIAGVHIWNISLRRFGLMVEMTAIASILYGIQMCLAKMAVLIWYLKFAREKWFTYAICVTMVCTAIYSAVLVLLQTFGCRPIAKTFDITVQGGTCINYGRTYLALAWLNVISDISILIMPIPMLLKLQVKRRQKAALFIVFSIGSMTMVTSIIRLTLLPPLIASKDMSWDLPPASNWILIEGNLVIICGCIPILRLFLRHVAPRLIGETRDESAHTGAGHKSSPASGTELSSVSCSKHDKRISKHKSVRDYSRMQDSYAPRSPSSQTHIVSHTDKDEVIAIEVAEMGLRDHNDSSIDHPMPIHPSKRFKHHGYDDGPPGMI